MSKKRMATTKKKRGPKRHGIRAEGVDWKDALKHALTKPKPKDGWRKKT